MKMKKLTAMTLALTMGIGAIGFSNTNEVHAAMPVPAIGQPYDGVDFSVTDGGLLDPTTHIYYGNYKHEVLLQNLTIVLTHDMKNKEQIPFFF